MSDMYILKHSVCFKMYIYIFIYKLFVNGCLIDVTTLTEVCFC